MRQGHARPLYSPGLRQEVEESAQVAAGRANRDRVHFHIALMDQKGNVADISIYDIYQSNGVIQVIDRVISPS